MCRTLLCLLAFLAFLSVTSLADAAPLTVMSAPNILRVGAAENIFVECRDCTENTVVSITVMSHPTKRKRLGFTSVTLNSGNQFQALAQITIPADDFSKNPNMKQYVYLQAQFPHVELEKVVLVSFQSGYIFIQTDKTLYTPNSKVLYRIFAMSPSMKPVEGSPEPFVTIEIVTPKGIIIPYDAVALNSGMYAGQHSLSEVASPGLWKVVAKFQSNPQQSFSAEFEVKEYVLPTFEVKLTPDLPYFNLNSEGLNISIKATYLFGEDVDGIAYVVFGIMNRNQKISFPSSLQKVQIKEGIGKAGLKKEHITQYNQNIDSLVGGSIYVTVNVMTDSGSEMAEAELRNIKIVKSPFTIRFKNQPKYFKPGISFDAMIEVVTPDGSPATKVPVIFLPHRVEAITSMSGTARAPIQMGKEKNESFEITAMTNVPGITQASEKLTVEPYNSKANHYIHIEIHSTEVQIGENFKINFYISSQERVLYKMTMLITSRGQLLTSKQYETDGLRSETVIVTKEMMPSFRIIAYYFTNDNEVVSDSVWVDVKDSCMGSLKLDPAKPTKSYVPGKMFDLKVTGDPEATVGLVAVDKGVYVLNNQHRLTQKKIWDQVEKYDTGCTYGGGKNGISVFVDAGLLFETNKAAGTPYRLEPKCQTSQRTKRSRTLMDIRNSLVSQFREKKHRDCCLDGMRDSPVSYTCERRSEYVVGGSECVRAFLQCCREMRTQKAERRHDSLLLARQDDDDSYSDSGEITSRSKFPESWQWTTIKLPACPKHTPDCGTTSHQERFPLMDSITTWQFTGISLSRTHGICVGSPLEIIARKDFFIDLKLPYSAVRGEQLRILAVLYNYLTESITVRLELIEKQHVCSLASRHGRYRQEVQVGSQGTHSVPFVIIPMKAGDIQVEVKAVVKDMPITDGIMKMLKVVPEGILTESVMIRTFNPANSGGRRLETMSSQIPEVDIVPHSSSWTYVSVTGREQTGALLENAISGRSMGTLIRQPSGCGEQNMISMTLPVIATIYLDKTNQWETVGFQRRSEALIHIKTGYKNELDYRKDDGSYAAFPDRGSSTWLTAYVAKVFAMANSLTALHHKDICEAINFLTQTQVDNGSFREVGEIIHGEMIGDVQGTDSDASLTAFCLIAMQESRSICNRTVGDLKGSIDRAVAFLERRLAQLTNPYAVAMTSYALANENKLDKQIIFKFASQDSTHWPVSSSHLFTLEATAYALLALVKTGDFESAKSVVRWFSKQQMYGGGYGSTQATIMVYQAIAEYWIGANEEEYNVNVNIKFAGRKDPEKFNINKNTQYATKSAKLNKINQDVTVSATGTGEVTLTMVSLYYALPKVKESNCKKFDLSVELRPVKLEASKKIYKLIIKFKYNNKDHDATMSILDIGFLTGFTFKIEDLKALSTRSDRIISKFELNYSLSEKGSLFIYLDRVSHTQHEEVAFEIHQTMDVGMLQPAAVSIYEYYNHQHNNQSEPQCIKFYHPERRDGALLRICSNDECACAEERCTMQRSEKSNSNERTNKICEADKTSKIDFAYKVTVLSFEDSLYTDVYTMQVVDVIKVGTLDVAPQGNKRVFLSPEHCRAALNMTKGNDYLVMGLARDIYKDDRNQTYQYLLGEKSWLEYWPTVAQCQTPLYRSTCLGLEDMVDQFKVFGCPKK